MPLDEKDVFEILALFEKSDWQELHLESGGVKLTVSKSGHAPQIVARAPSAPRETRVTEPAPAARAAAAPQATTAKAPPAQASEPVEPSWQAVRSPTLGNFYLAPKPGAPPFVQVGQSVGEDDTVAIVEVMKLMNHVKAGVRGKVARVAAENGDLVEYEQVLFWIDSEGA